MNILKTIIISSIALISCDENTKVDLKKGYKDYTVLVNYTSNFGTFPPSDTIIISSRHEPYMAIRNGVAVIEGSDIVDVYASNVRSYKILSQTK
jgi:hypothetical protein